jgi:transcriptional antiterminator
MADQAKFQKMLEVLLMLDCKYGRTIQELSDRFDISQRTVYRDMVLEIISNTTTKKKFTTPLKKCPQKGILDQ